MSLHVHCTAFYSPATEALINNNNNTLLKVVDYYDLSVLSMSVMGFQKKKFGWGGGCVG